MQSRELKRLQTEKKEADHKPTDSRFKHPIFYAFSVAILLIIIVTFVGGPLLGGSGGRSDLVFGSWGGVPIKYQAGNYLSRQRDILYDQLLESGTDESYEWQAYSVWKGAYDRTVLHTAILEMADRSGLYVSNDRIDEALLTSGPYMQNGKFSEEIYRSTSNAERYRYRSLVRDDLIHQQYLNDLNHETFYSEAAGKFLMDMASDERSFRFVDFTYSDYPDSEVAAYGADNQDQFRRIKLSRITVKSSAAEAETIRRQILDGVQTFEDQARNHSTDGFSEQGGEMGWREYQALRSDFPQTSDLDALFAMSAGDITGVYEASFGFVFYRVDEAAIVPDLESEDTLESVRTYMERFERGRIEDYLLDLAASFKTAAGELGGFEAAADAQSVEVLETGFFPINYGGSFFLRTPTLENNATSAALGSASYNQQFFMILFGLEEGEVSDPIILDESIGVFELKEARTQDSEEIGYLADYYPYIYQQYLDQDLTDYIFASDEFEDNFINVFSEIFLSN